MKAKELFSGILNEEKLSKIQDKSISRIVANSKGVEDGDVFVCLKGGKFNGIDYVAEAINNGASFVVSEEDLGLDNGIVVENSRSAFALLSKNINNRACDKLNIIGITGTNGKTSIANMLGGVLAKLGRNVGVIGTLGASYAGKRYETGFTTPDPDVLHRIFKDMVVCGVDTVVMEVSAHALALDKLDGIKFSVGVLTNITQDHLDFFKTMDAYAKAKFSFFDAKYCKTGLICSDDDYAKKLMFTPNLNLPIVSYGINNPSDCFATSIKQSSKGSKFYCNCVDDIAEVNTKFLGKFNIENTLATITTACLQGFKLNDVVKALSEIDPIEGRMNVIDVEGVNVIIDYAHTPDGLENILKTAKSLTSGKLYALFGCGGNRDKSKRPIMGKIASKLADHVILTSDNPRFEEPNEIIKEIQKGVSGSYEICANRSCAIQTALSKCSSGDTLVIAGKGAERTQEINGQKIPFSDYEEVYKHQKLRKSICGVNDEHFD